jgi:hypothetical protein
MAVGVSTRKFGAIEERRMRITLAALARPGAFAGNYLDAGAVTDIARVSVHQRFLFGKVRDDSEFRCS